MKKKVKERKVLSGLRSQTTVFIIIAVVLVAVVGVIVLLSSRGNNGGTNLNPFRSGLDNVKDSIIQCSKDNSREGIKRIGIQGGYFQKPEYSEDLGWAFIPYYYYRGNILLPNKTVIENQISSYVDEKISYCLNEIPSSEYKLEYDKPKTKSTISPGKIRLVIDLPVTIKKGDQVNVLQLKDNEITFNSSLFDIYEIADFLTKSHVENPNMFCANCIVDMAKQRNLYVDLIDYKDNSTMVMISENWSYAEPYLFEFLNKY